MQTDEFRKLHGRSGRGEDNNAVFFYYGGPGVSGIFVR